MNVADWLGVDDWQGWWDTNEAIEIYAIASNAHVTNDNPAWNTVRLFARMMLQIDRAMVGA